VTSDRGALAVFKDGLGFETGQVDTLEGAVCVSNITQADLAWILTLSEQGELRAELEGQKWIVRGMEDRLSAWESELATEPRPPKLNYLVPATHSNDQTGSTVKMWFTQCSGFRSWEVDELEYDSKSPIPAGWHPASPPQRAGDAVWFDHGGRV
jgi:hypothetical protein